MKNLKKVLALVLAFACAFTMFAGAAFTDEADIQAKDAVNMLTALGVIEGYEDGSFNPDGVVTRAEMAKMIFVVRNNTIDDSAYANNTSKLTDITNHWAKGYIKFCESQGIIAGYGDNTFKPDATVTGVEAAKMLLVLTGYDADKAGLTGTAWATNTLRYAGSAGILDDVNSGLESGLPRQYAAQMIYNTLDANRVKWSDDSQSFDDVLNGGIKETVGSAYMGLSYDVGTMTEMSKDSLTIKIDGSYDSDNYHQSKDYKTVSFTKVGSDYSKLLGQKVKVMFKDGKTNNVLGIYAISDNTSYTVAANGTEKDGDKVKFGGSSYSVEFYGDADNKTIYDSNKGDAIATYIDGQVAEGTTLDELDNNKLNPNMYTFVDTDGNGKIDTLNVTTYNVAKVSYASSDKIIASGKTYKTADENIADGIAKDDWVVITENLYNDNKDIVKADMSTGTLNGLRDNQSANIFFDGGDVSTSKETYNEYRVGDDWFKGAAKVQSTASESDLNTVKAGNEVEYVVVNNIMFYVKRVSGKADGKVDEVAMIVNKGTTGIDNEVKLAFFDGTTKTVEVDSDSPVKWDDLKPGTVYEYDVSGDEYSFGYDDDNNSGTAKNLRLDEEYYGDMTYMGSQKTSGTDAFNSVGKYTIDDDAEVLLFLPKRTSNIGDDASGNDSKKISGKQFKALADGKIIDSSEIYAFYGSMSGIDRVGAMAVAVDSLDGIVKTWSNYGYIVTKPYKVDNSTIEYTFWNGSENVTVQEDKNSTSDRAKGTVIGYDTLTEKDGVKVIDDVDHLTDSDITFTAVTSVNDKKDTAIFAKDPVGANGNHELDKVSSSDVFYIDTDADEDLEIGVEDGEIKEAQKVDGDYLANALVIGNDDEIELLIIDQGEYLDNDVYRVDATGDVVDGEDANASDVEIGSINDVAVGESVDMDVTVTTKNINKGTSVRVSLSNADGLTASATDIDSDGKSVVTIKGTPKKDGTATLKVTVDGKTVSASFIINKEASNVVLKLAGTANKSLEYAKSGNFTVTAGYQNAWLQELKVSIKDSANGDASSKFTTTFATGGIIGDNNADTDTLTITEKGSAAIGTYTATVSLGDKNESFTFEVTASEIADANGLTFTLDADPTKTDAPDTLAVTPAAGDAEKYTVTSTKWYTDDTEVTGSNQLGTGTVKLVIVLTANDNYKFADNATTTKQAGLSNKTATSDVAEDGSTLTLTYEWTVS